MKKRSIEFPTLVGLNADTKPQQAALKDGKLTASTATNVLFDQTTGEIIKAPGSSAYVSLPPYNVGTIVLSGHPADTNKIKVGSHTYEFDSNSTITEGNVSVTIAADKNDTATNLVTAINTNETTVDAAKFGNASIQVYNYSSGVRALYDAVAAGGSNYTVTRSFPFHAPLGFFEYITNQGLKLPVVRTANGYFVYRHNGYLGSKVWHCLLETYGDVRQIPSFAQIADKLLIVDGVQNYTWDGVSDTLTKWPSTDVPSSPVAMWGGDDLSAAETYYSGKWRPKAVLSAGAGLTANASYEVCFAFAKTTGSDADMSHFSPIMSAKTDATNKQIKIYTGYAYDGEATASGFGRNGTTDKALRCLPTNANFIRFYISEANVPGVWYYDSQIAANASTAGTEIIGTLDANYTAAANETLVTDNVSAPPHGVTKVVNHGERAFVCGAPGFPNRLWFSEAGDPFTWKPWAFLNVGGADDPVVSLVSMAQACSGLVILKRNSVWMLQGYDSETYATGLCRIMEGAGCLSPHSPIMVDKSVYWWGSGGFYQFDCETVRTISQGVGTLLDSAIRGVA